MKPILTVWVAPALGGKTRRCITECLQGAERVRLILPADLQAQMARAILLAEGMAPRTAEKVTQSLHNFAVEVASASNEIRFAPVHLRRWLLQRAIQATAQPGTWVERAARREGILALLSAWVREMAREGVSAEWLQQLAVHSQEQEKIALLAQILRHYRLLLAARGWHEEEDIYLLAAQTLRESQHNMVLPRRVLLDGFARLSRTETEFLRVLGEAGCELVFTLCWEQKRDVLFENARTTLQWLSQHFEVRLEPVSQPPDEHTAPAIAHIAAHLFGAPTAPLGDEQTTPAVEIWEAPHLLAEVEMVAREIVRYHRNGMAWGEMAVLCRDIGSVLPALNSVFTQFGIPSQSFEAKTLGEHPLVRALVSLLRLHESDYAREEVLRWLKSGYLPIDILSADRVRLLAVRRGVRAGANSWLHLAEQIEEEHSAAASLLRTLVQSTQSLAQATTPRQWLDTLQRSLSAMQFGMSVLNSEQQDVLAQAMETAQQVISLLIQDEEGTPGEWARAVQQAWEATPQKYETSLRNAVWLLEATRSRPLRPRVVFVMGVQEGRFPRRITEDALLRDDDRRWLNQHAGCHLPLTTDHAALERLAFYQAATCASHKVVFTYSRTEGDHDVQPSFYLRSLHEIFSAGGVIQRSLRLSDITAPLSHTLDDWDAERTLVDSLFDTNPHTRRIMDEAERQRTAYILHRWLTEQPARCRQWWRWRHLPDFPRLTAVLPHIGSRAYSASELEELQRCPFRHFVRWELKLRGERSHYAAAQGRWLHAVMNSRRRHPQQPLEELLQEVARQHPVDRPAGERHLLLQQLQEMVRSVLEREEQIYSGFGLQTLWTEAAFGPAHEEEEEPPEDVAPPLRLTLPGGERMLICGRIDRVDVCPQTGAAVLVDYKRDLPDGWWQSVQMGEDLQTVLYVAALRQVWKLNAAAVALDDALEAKRYRVLFTDTAPPELLQRLNKQPQEDFSVVQRVHGQRWKSIERTAAQKISQLLHHLQTGDIRPVPGDHCKLCEYGGICRTVRRAGAAVHDGEPYPAEGGVV
ncbi:MAG: exodeoxyribonuclease V subunit gamma [bacterium]|nr:exodeoxyribonuclease V subunit gamma [bacterium]